MNHFRKNEEQPRKGSLLKVIWLLPSLTVVGTVIIVLTSGLPYNKLHTIEDASYVQQLSHQAVPESLTLLDPVWGSVIIEQPDKVLACYDLLTRLPFVEKEDKSQGRIRNRELSGTINFLDRPNIHFSIFDSVVVDGITYGDANTQLEASFLAQELCEAFYTPENLSSLIDRYTRIVLRTDSSRINLSTTAKKQLKEEILACKLLRDNDQLSEVLRGKGNALCQIEIYTDDTQTENKPRQIPQIYIAVYANGLLAVYDVDHSVGSDMHLLGDLQSIHSILRQR
ncbi:DUF3919 family protein [Marasmitruncus massiliensis]|uniref:DUF3919 family protein n=1 Tax=Marasmitruncus massiliensis TaxID=1944642 RepID=UPI000C7D2C11|nr:DUF3919 family protein [Marasmitruncus massiliensis]